MRHSTTSALSAVLLASTVAAFPHAAMDAMTAPLLQGVEQPGEILKRQSASPPQGSGALPSTPPPFDAASQLIDVSGTHAFIAPSSTDVRGMCPGLNALANHGYLPRNGQATINQFIQATTSVFGMGEDLATFLSVYGAVLDGSGTGWSIGGAPHTGIGGSHGNYETDSSPFKSDLYQYGSNGQLVMSQFQNLYNRQPANASANYNLEVLRDFRGSRFQESISKNPYFAYQPFAGVAVSQAAFTFIYRFMANHTAAAPEGVLNRDVLKSFNSITGPDNNLTWTFGNERIPANWYRRNAADAYTIPYFIADIFYIAAKYPAIGGIGCNTGTVNSYNSFNASVFTNGAYSVSQAAANPLCFAAGVALVELPVITGLTSTLLAPLVSVLNNVTATLQCSQTIGSVNRTVFAVCPGAALYDGPTASVAPGAIQS